MKAGPTMAPRIGHSHSESQRRVASAVTCGRESYPLLFMVVHQMSLFSAFTPSLGFVWASILVRNILCVWIMPRVPLLGEPSSVMPEAFVGSLTHCQVGLIVHGEYKPRDCQG